MSGRNGNKAGGDYTNQPRIGKARRPTIVRSAQSKKEKNKRRGRPARRIKTKKGQRKKSRKESLKKEEEEGDQEKKGRGKIQDRPWRAEDNAGRKIILLKE